MVSFRASERTQVGEKTSLWLCQAGLNVRSDSLCPYSPHFFFRSCRKWGHAYVRLSSCHQWKFYAVAIPPALHIQCRREYTQLSFFLLCCYLCHAALTSDKIRVAPSTSSFSFIKLNTHVLLFSMEVWIVFFIVVIRHCEFNPAAMVDWRLWDWCTTSCPFTGGGFCRNRQSLEGSNV